MRTSSCVPGGCATDLDPRQPTDHIYYAMTKSVCSVCLEAVDGKIVLREEAVYLDKFCPEHGKESHLVSSSLHWYLDSLSFIAPSTPPQGSARPAAAGCPYDCGPCVLHQQRTILARVRPEDLRPEKEARASMGTGDVDAAPPCDLEVVSSPEEVSEHLLQWLRSLGPGNVRLGVQHLDEPLAFALAKAGVEAVLEIERPGPSLEASLDALARAGAPARVRCTLRPDTLERDLPGLLAALLHEPVLEVELVPSGGLTVPDVHRVIEEKSGISPRDFVPSPRAHPLCYSIALLVVRSGVLVPMARSLSRAELFGLLETPSETLGLAPLSDRRVLSIHALMDAATFDVARVMRCGVGTRAGEANIPLCADRVVYRDEAGRFAEPAPRQRAAAAPKPALPILGRLEENR